jgi:hypothetical protein
MIKNWNNFLNEHISDLSIKQKDLLKKFKIGDVVKHKLDKLDDRLGIIKYISDSRFTWPIRVGYDRYSMSFSPYDLLILKNSQKIDDFDPYGEENWNDDNWYDPCNEKLNVSKSEDIIEKIKEYLVRDNDYESWEEFVDSQRMGDCQGNVASIIHEFPQVTKVFGRVKIDTPCVDWDDGSESDEITHHWVEIDGTAYDFSKGTLNGYIDMDDYDLYDPEIVDTWRYELLPHL